MRLTNQVEILKGNLPEIQNLIVSLPLHGDSLSTSRAYQFTHLILPARDIMTTIHMADPSGELLPSHLRGWSISVSDGMNRQRKIHLKRLLGMIVHIFYLDFNETNLDVINDSSERVIVDRGTFLQQLERLVLAREDIGLVASALAEKSLFEITGSNIPKKPWTAEIPGCRDIEETLRNIETWPDLAEIIWSKYFSQKSTRINPSENTVNRKPFINGIGYNPGIITWNRGWRRETEYSHIQIEPTQIIATIRDYIQEKE